MKGTDRSLELCSLHHTIDDLLALQQQTDNERLQQQLENERLQQNLTKHRQVIRNLRRQLEKQQATQSQLSSALHAALLLQEAGHGDD